MRLSISTPFNNDLIDNVKGTAVTQLFGKLPNDYVGGGLERHNLNQDELDENRLAEHIKYAHENGLTFNYTFNAPCLDNKEFTNEGRKNLRELAELVINAGVDEVTVANPQFIPALINDYPELNVKVSATMCIDSVHKAKRMEDLGVNCIVLDPMVMNRDFAMLEAIREGVDIDLELIVNNNCLWHCPILTYHQTYLGHSSQKGNNTDVPYDYVYLKGCSADRIKNKEAWIIADWIRPEDLHLYEEIGYDYFKIIDRAAPMDVMVNRAKAYSERHYDGNLLDLIQHWGYRDIREPQQIIDNVYVDNKKLDKHLKFFTRNTCASFDCGNSCRHCFKYADKAVTINTEFASEYMDEYNGVMDKLDSWQVVNFA